MTRTDYAYSRAARKARGKRRYKDLRRAKDNRLVKKAEHDLHKQAYDDVAFHDGNYL